MKRILIVLLALVSSNGFAFSLKSPTNCKTVLQITTPIDSSTKKMSRQDWKNVEIELKKTLPKNMAKTIMKQLKLAETMDKSGGVTDKQAIANLIAKGIADHADELDYELERKEIIDDFKSGEYDTAAKKREARKEMKEALKELKKEYKADLKRKKREKKEIDTHFI